MFFFSKFCFDRVCLCADAEVQQAWQGLCGLFEQFGNDRDTMIAFNRGSHKAAVDVRKGLNTLGVTIQSILPLLFH